MTFFPARHDSSFCASKLQKAKLGRRGWRRTNVLCVSGKTKVAVRDLLRGKI